jgi:arylsulfatase A-like enzyme
MTHQRAAQRSYWRRWRDTLGAGVLGAFMVATLEVLFVAARLPAATSSPLGFAMTWAMAFALFGGYAILGTTLLALVGTARVTRMLARGGDGVVFALSWALMAMAPLAALGELFAVPWEFPREMRAMHAILELGGLFAVLIVAYATRLRFMTWVASTIPWRLRRRVAAILLALAAVTGVACGHLLLAPESLVVPCGIVGGATLALAVLASSTVVPRTRTLREAAAVLVLPVAAVAWFVPGAASAHARFLVWNHTAFAAPMAEVIRNALDRDHDGGAPTWLGGTDCAEGDAKRGPLLREIPDDGIDQDCRGGDAPVPTPPPAAIVPSDCYLPNARLSVLLVTIDALRFDRATAALMPALATLAAQSTTFVRAYAPTGLTVTSVAAMMTARPLADLVDNALEDDDLRAPFTLASLFKAAGYRTAAFNPFELHAIHSHGFEHVNDSWMDLSPIGAKETLTSGALARAAIHFATEASDAPFFAWVHFADVHARYKFDRDEAGRARSESDAYDRGVAYTGEALGSLLGAMQQHGLLAHTVVVVTADHGEELMARGREGHGANLFEESTHVPLVVWIPGCAPRVVDRPVGSTQIGPTLGALTRVNVPGWGLFDPRPLPVVTEATVGYDTQFKRAIVGDRYKLIVDVPNGGRMLFDLQSDPGETTNLYGRAPAERDAMESAYQHWLDAPGAR